MKTSIEYRRLSENELYIISEMWVELNDYHIPLVSSFHNRFCNVSFEKHLKELQDADEKFGYVATSNNERIGFVLVKTQNDTAEIDSIYVRSNFRGKGIGDILMKKAMDELVGKFATIVMQVADGNEQSFHSRYGFKKRYILFQYDYGYNNDDQ